MIQETKLCNILDTRTSLPERHFKTVGVGATFVITGVGEAQSDLNDAALQGGIYAVGELRKRKWFHQEYASRDYSRTKFKQGA